MTPEDDIFPWLECPALTGSRYEYLRHTDSNRDLKYFFALDLHQCAKLLPRLIGSIVEIIRFLGPEKCGLSVIEGRSDDGTFEILRLLREDLESIGTTYYFNSSDIGQRVGERVEALAKLRNLALEPLINDPERYSTNATVVFINDVSVCMEDTLELIHQRIYQKADTTCPMDWIFPAGLKDEPTFYDVWVTRGMTGDSFFDIPVETGSWDYAWNLLWNDPKALKRLYAHGPFQAFLAGMVSSYLLQSRYLNKRLDFAVLGMANVCRASHSLFCKDL
jgi:alpha-1,3-mannosyltransferase